MFKITKGLPFPKVILQVFAANKLPGVVQQKQEELKRFTLEPDWYSALGQAAGYLIVFEGAET